MSTDGLKQGDELPNDDKAHNMLYGTLAQAYDIAAEHVRIVGRFDISHDTKRGRPFLSRGLAYNLEDAYEHPHRITRRPFCEIEDEDKTMQNKGAPIKFGLRYPPPHMVVDIWQFGFSEAEHWPYVNVVYKQQYFYGWKLIEENKLKIKESGVFNHAAYPDDTHEDSINNGSPKCPQIQTFEFKVQFKNNNKLTEEVWDDEDVVRLTFKGTGIENFNDSATFNRLGGNYQFTRFGCEDNFCYDIIGDRYHVRCMSAVIYGSVYMESERERNGPPEEEPGT